MRRSVAPRPALPHERADAEQQCRKPHPAADDGHQADEPQSQHGEQQREQLPARRCDVAAAHDAVQLLADEHRGGDPAEEQQQQVEHEHDQRERDADDRDQQQHDQHRQAHEDHEPEPETAQWFLSDPLRSASGVRRESEHEQGAGDEHAEHPQERANPVRNGVNVPRILVLVDVVADVCLVELDATRDLRAFGQRGFTRAVDDELAVDTRIRADVDLFGMDFGIALHDAVEAHAGARCLQEFLRIALEPDAPAGQ